MITVMPADLKRHLNELWQWRNDVATRKALNGLVVTREEFEKNALERAHGGDYFLCVIWLDQATPIGYGELWKDGRWHIFVSVDKAYRGNDYGKAAIKALTDRALSEGALHSKVEAKVKIDNYRALIAFDSAGYVEENASDKYVTLVYPA